MGAMVIAVFSAVIAFPLVRLVATGLHARTVRRAQGQVELQEVAWASVTADGMRETFALDSAIFDVGQKHAINDSKL